MLGIPQSDLGMVEGFEEDSNRVQCKREIFKALIKEVVCAHGDNPFLDDYLFEGGIINKLDGEEGRPKISWIEKRKWALKGGEASDAGMPLMIV
ncbi:hypothetical protein U1Q18_023549 [Sarracenia purpurea var. burkii]